MTKKKIGLLVTAVALVGAVAVGGTLAWFTDKADVENKMQLNHVDVTVSEPEYNPSDVQDLVPGDKFVKDPTITVTEGSADVYVRVKAPNVVLPELEKSFPLLGTDPSFEAKLNDAANWVEKTAEDGTVYYYYTKSLKAGDSLAFLEKQGEGEDAYTMQIPGEWSNDFADANIELDFHFEAIQAKNFTPDFDAADPWNGAEITESK